MNNVWHPFTQHKIEKDLPNIVRAEGVYLHTKDGRKIIDGISSWWLALFGHSNPFILEGIREQLDKFQQFIFAGFKHDLAYELADELLSVLPNNQEKVFFSDNGSTSIEVALKMASQYWTIKGEDKTKFITLKGAYHGDTVGAMSLGMRSVFSSPFKPMLFDVLQFEPPFFGYVDESIKEFVNMLDENPDIGAFVYEPIVQGASGMRMYSEEALDKILGICKERNILTIADEVAVGFGKLGKLFASDFMENKPDIMCLSKALTGGVLPMGITTATEEVYSVFHSEDRLKMFLHGHSFTANAISSSAALATLKLVKEAQFLENVKSIENKHCEFSKELESLSNIEKIRYKGLILAFDVLTEEETNYANPLKVRLYKDFLKRDVLLRPLGNVIYVLPPSVIKDNELSLIYDTILEVLKEY